MSRLEQIVFAIDKNYDAHTVSKFMRYMDTQRAMGRADPVVQCIGAWTDEEGETYLEPSYMVSTCDFDKHVKDSGYVDDQVCFLVIPGDTRQPCALRYPDGSQEALSPMRKITSTLGVTNWTYVIETGGYFTC